MLRSTRRELLAAFLGIAAGCSRHVPDLPPGEIIGADYLLGHRLRGGEIPRPENWQEVPVAIVGAGVAGLAAAWRLSRKGFDRYTVLELEGAAGGTSRTGTRGVTPHPWGAHYLPAPMADNTDLLALLREMGVVEGTEDDGEPAFAEQVLCRDPHERLFARGEWHEGLWPTLGASAEDERQRRAFFREIDSWVAWRDGKGRRAFALPSRKASDDPHALALDRLTVSEWMRTRGFDSPRLRWLVAYACRDDYGAEPEETSAWAGLFYFASRRKKPGAASQPMLTWPEGNGRLVANLAKAAKGKIQVGQAVLDLDPDETGVRLTALAANGRVTGIRARRVIFAGPRFVAKHAIRPWRHEPPRHLLDFSHGSWAVANLHLRGRPIETSAVPLSWDNVLYESKSLGYVVATHQTGRDHGPTILTYYYPMTGEDVRAGREEMLRLGRDEWAELALADLERAHPDLRGLCERIDVMRWGHAMIRPRPGLVSGTSRREARKPYRGIHFAHSDLSGLPLFEEAFDHGLRAADEVLAALG